MPNIVIKDEQGNDEIYQDVNTVRFLNENGGLVSYKYDGGEYPTTDEDDTIYTHGTWPVWFFDIDGNVYYKVVVDDGGSVEMPADPPAVEGYTFLGWNHTVEDLQNIRRPYTVGPIYKFSDYDADVNVFKVNIDNKYKYNVGLTWFVKNNASAGSQQYSFDIDWGDGSTETVSNTISYNSITTVTKTHTYTNLGKYAITLTKTGTDTVYGFGYPSISMSASISYSCIKNNSYASETNKEFNPVTEIQFATNTQWIGVCACYAMGNLKRIFIQEQPIGYTLTYSSSQYIVAYCDGFISCAPKLPIVSLPRSDNSSVASQYYYLIAFRSAYVTISIPHTLRIMSFNRLNFETPLLRKYSIIPNFNSMSSPTSGSNTVSYIGNLPWSNYTYIGITYTRGAYASIWPPSSRITNPTNRPVQIWVDSISTITFNTTQFCYDSSNPLDPYYSYMTHISYIEFMTDICLISNSNSDYTHFFGACPSLQYLYFDGNIQSISSSYGNTYIKKLFARLPALKELKITGSFLDNNICSIFPDENLSDDYYVGLFTYTPIGISTINKVLNSLGGTFVPCGLLQYCYPHNDGDDTIIIPEGVTTLKVGALQNINYRGSNKVKLSLPSTLTTINNMGLGISESTPIEILCYATTPPSGYTIPTPTSFCDMTIHVPAESYDAYTSSSAWSNVKSYIIGDL